MSTLEYAKAINKAPRTVQDWCKAGLIDKRVGGRWEIDEGTEPPAIFGKRKVGRVKRAARLQNFKRKPATADQQAV